MGGHACRIRLCGGGARGCGGLGARAGARAGLAVGGHAVGQRGAGDGRDDAAGAAAGGLFAGTPAGPAPGAAKEPQRDAPASEGGLAAACERGHLLDFIRDGASMLVRSAVLQARARAPAHAKRPAACVCMSTAPALSDRQA